MATKAELLVKAKELGLEMSEDNTVKEIQEAIDGVAPENNPDKQTPDGAKDGHYRIRMVNPHSGGFMPEARPRAGIIVSAATGWEGELTQEQVAEIQADPYLTVTKA